MAWIAYIFKRKVRYYENSDYIVNDSIILAVIAIALCAIGLIIVPEVIYVKDIYGELYARYNTMFKLTYQAFILLGILSGISISLLFKYAVDNKNHYIYILTGFYMLCVLGLAGFTFNAVTSWFGNIISMDKRLGISATDSMKTTDKYIDDFRMIDIINEDASRRVHIMEENGDSYKPESKIAVFTGASNVGGWYVHEWMWHNEADTIQERRDEISKFYMLGSSEYCRYIIDKYDLDYIYVGRSTIEKYPVNYIGFETLGEHLYESKDGLCMLIKVNSE